AEPETDLRVRLRRRARPRQAAADGPNRRTAGRPGCRDLGQSARRGPAAHHRRHPRRHAGNTGRACDHSRPRQRGAVCGGQRPARRRRTGRGQGTRDLPTDRRREACIQRRRRGAACTGASPMMMRLSEAAQAIGGELRGEDREFDAVSSDTRALPPHALFVALKGERFDGHDFLARAAELQAAAALVDLGSARAQEAGLSSVAVEDTRLALGRLAAYWRSKFAIPLVALTGSNGKTTVKDMLASILREAFDESRAPDSESRVLATRGNLNNDIGVPLTLLELRSGHRCAVIEMGM